VRHNCQTGDQQLSSLHVGVILLLPFKSLGLVSFVIVFKEVPYSPQGCIYFILKKYSKNNKKCEILFSIWIYFKM